MHNGARKHFQRAQPYASTGPITLLPILYLFIYLFENWNNFIAVNKQTGILGTIFLL